MPNAVPHTALTTLAEFQRIAMRSDGWAERLHADADLGQAVVDIIVDKSAAVDRFLNRTLIVRRYENRLSWDLCPDGGYVARTKSWPVVQVDTSGVTINDDGDLESASIPGKVVYYAGYRREDQDLEVLQEHVAGLMVLPPVLPGDIRGVVNDLVMIQARRRISGTLGVSSRSQTVGGETVSYQREQANSESQLLETIRVHRRIPV